MKNQRSFVVGMSVDATAIVH